jgi:RNA polymerase sigma factor (sigma-70 family)
MMVLPKPDANDADPPEELLSIEELFASQESLLLAYAHKFVRNSDLAQDLVQEAFMKLHSHFSEVQRPKRWLYRTVHNLAVNCLRNDRKIVPLQNSDDERLTIDPVDPELHPDAHLERLETIGQTRAGLDSLDDRSRELIRLKFEEGHSYKEISAKTGLTVSNVGYILHHALKTLSVHLQKSGVEL